MAKKKSDGIYWHKRGYWCKSYRGKKLNLGKGSRREAEHRLKVIQARDTLNQPEEVDTEGLTVEGLVTLFLESRKAERERGDIGRLTYRTTVKRSRFLAEQLGHRKVDSLKGYDFTRLRNSMSPSLMPSTINEYISKIRQVFVWGSENELCKLPKFGSLKRVSNSEIRKAKPTAGSRIFSHTDCLSLLEESKSNLTMRCFILLGLNAAMDGSSIGLLESKNISGDWLRQMRPKTGVERIAFLWPETLDAIKQAETHAGGAMFRTRFGNSWATGETGGSVGKMFSIIRNRAGCESVAGFHGLRRTLATVANQLPVKDSTIRKVMAHADRDMLHAAYVQGIDEAAIRKCCEGVRVWLFHNADFMLWKQIAEKRDLEPLGGPTEAKRLQQQIIAEHPSLGV